jgi:tetratricopeptide (TPR) repeat protein
MRLVAGGSVDGPYFISYSRVDAEDFARQLADELVAGPPTYPVWLDARDLEPGGDWDTQIRDALQACGGVLFVMTADGVQDHSVTKSEWAWALKYKKPVIPLRAEAGAELPFRLASRQFLDFSDGFDVGLARLRNYLVSVGSPKWVLRDLRDQQAEAERELPRADPEQRPRIRQDIDDLRRRVGEQERLVADPGAAARRTEERIAAGLEQQRQPERPEVAPARARFVNQPPVAAPSYFQDRHNESEQIGEFLRAADERIVTVVGRGGVGKTAMVCRLLKAVEGGQLPDGLGDLEVDGIVYLSPSGAHPVSFPNLFDDLCRLLPDEVAGRLRQAYREPHHSPAELMRSLLDAFPSGRVVVLLDNFEDVIDSSSVDLGLTDPVLDEALRALLAAPPHAVKVIVTTRVAPRGLLLDHPERQRLLDLDEGLPSPYAERVLRARDPDGRLGLLTADDELLGLARERTRGYPRALELLAAILFADRGTTLAELLAETAGLPGNVVQALVGEAFSRLDPLAQQVVQALAVYPVPVPPVAVDYLLQPYQSAIDAAPVLGRLVNMQFVRREAGRYYLHQVDRDYALSRLPEGEIADRDADPPVLTRQALRHRGAGYFEQTRTPREDWKTLDDLGPQLAEFELRYQGSDSDAAAQVLLGIDFDYLTQWGHYRLTAEMHERLQGHLDDPFTSATSKTSLATCYYLLGQFTRATDLFEQALAIARETGDRVGETSALGNLASCYGDLGQIPRAIELYEQALAGARETGNRGGEARWLDGLAICYAALGQTARAIELYEQALPIYRETGNRADEARGLLNLGNSYGELGQTAQAIELYEQALAIARQIGYRLAEAASLASLGEAYGDLGSWDQGARYSQEAIDIADAIGSAQAQSEARRTLALIQLLTGDLAAARQAINAARDHDYPADRARLSLLSGIIRLRQGRPSAAAEEFQASITQAVQQLEQASGDYVALDTQALALCGLALTTEPGKAAEACTVFRAARAVTSADGIVRRTLALFDAQAVADQGGILAGTRQAVEAADLGNDRGSGPTLR